MITWVQAGNKNTSFVEKVLQFVLLLMFTLIINYMKVCTCGWGTEGSAVSGRKQHVVSRPWGTSVKTTPWHCEISEKMLHRSSIDWCSKHSINKSFVKGWAKVKVCLMLKWLKRQSHTAALCWFIYDLKKMWRTSQICWSEKGFFRIS